MVVKMWLCICACVCFWIWFGIKIWKEDVYMPEEDEQDTPINYYSTVLLPNGAKATVRLANANNLEAEVAADEDTDDTEES